jgi:hypothetical protein
LKLFSLFSLFSFCLLCDWHPFSQKRGVDFGLGRGYSGSQAAKHLMGLAAANYAIGPGRKRRDTTESTPEDVKTGAIN